MDSDSSSQGSEFYEGKDDQEVGDMKKVEDVKDMHYDEAFEINDSDENSVPSVDDHEGGGVGNSSSQESEYTSPQKNKPNLASFKQQTANKQSQDEGEDEEVAQTIKNAYNPADYANLQVSQEIKELFQYIQRYKPHQIDLETKVRPFIPDYIAAVGEVDAFLKVPRPDGTDEILGILLLDEPKLNQSDPALLEIKLKPKIKRPGTGQANVRSIENADKNPKQITRWISTISEAHRSKPPANVSYTKPMPDSDTLMDVWHPEMEEILNTIELPSPDLDVSLEGYIRIICSILGIPVHDLSNKKSNIESLHVLFTLYSDFKSNQHFKQDFIDYQQPITYD
jgi:intraflagellar transport protein 46